MNADRKDNGHNVQETIRDREFQYHEDLIHNIFAGQYFCLV
jgi:hypothetical protein